MSKSRILLLLAILVAIFALIYFDAGRFIDPRWIESLFQKSPLVSALVFFMVYVFAAALSVPAAVILTLIGGMFFGLWLGVLLVSFASSIGAMLAFLAARYLLRDWVQNKLSDRLAGMNRGVEKDGALYLFSLRLIPVVPFWVINLAMALTPLKTWTFYWVSQLGMLPATLVYVNAGAALSDVDEISLQGILTPQLLIAFVGLAMLPFLARFLVRVVTGITQRSEVDK